MGVVEFASHDQTGLGRGAGDQFHHREPARQRRAAPIPSGQTAAVRERRRGPHVPEPLHGNIAVWHSKLSDLRPVTFLAVLPDKNRINRSPVYNVTALRLRSPDRADGGDGGLSVRYAALVLRRTRSARSAPRASMWRSGAWSPKPCRGSSAIERRPGLMKLLDGYSPTTCWS
jgi:hypothetical protein